LRKRNSAAYIPHNQLYGLVHALDPTLDFSLLTATKLLVASQTSLAKHGLPQRACGTPSGAS
jgi:hypothetical protein